MISWFQRRQRQKAADKVRSVPDSYINAGYRRLATTPEEVIGEHCWNCRHQRGLVTWWCDLGVDVGYRTEKCTWERCYVATEITKADLRAGRKDIGGWIGLPPEPVDQPAETK